MVGFRTVTVVWSQAWASGSRRDGKLGIGGSWEDENENVVIPQPIPSLTAVVQVSAGGWHTVFVAADT